MSLEVSGVLGTLFFLIIVWAIYKTIKSPAGSGKKLVWILALLLVPVIGLIAWVLFGPKG